MAEQGEDNSQGECDDECLSVSGIAECQYLPMYYTMSGDKVYKVCHAPLGYELMLTLPWWVTDAHLDNWDGGRQCNYIIATDKVHGISIEIIVECLTDRRNQPIRMTHSTLMRHFCTVDWFGDGCSPAMYYTDDPLQGFQMYTVFSEEDIIQPQPGLLDKYADLYNLYKQDKHKERLNSTCCNIFTELITYFTKHHINSSRQLNSTVYKAGQTLLRKLFVCQELHHPLSIQSLQKLSAVTTALCVRDPHKLSSLPLTLSVYREVEEIMSNFNF